MRLSPGLRIGRKLALVRQIGQGGMATVWEAEEPGGGRRAAVKILDTSIAESAMAVERFTAEGAAMARIRSPFVPRVHERGRLRDGTPYTVMELVEGVDLDVYLRRSGRLSLLATMRLVTQVAAALTAAHAIGVVHRDVKAENILVTGRGEQLRAMLVDFGIAKVPIDEPGRHGTESTTMGTPAYMSPEQLASTKDVDARADLWSLAVAAYFALTGKMPFDGETFLAVCLSIHEGIFDLPSHLLPAVPPAVDAWLSKALHRDPAQRFQTAQEMSDALAAIVHSNGRRTLELELEPEPAVDAARSSLGALTRPTRPARRPARRWRNGVLITACAGFFALWGMVPPLRAAREATASSRAVVTVRHDWAPASASPVRVARPPAPPVSSGTSDTASKSRPRVAASPRPKPAPSAAPAASAEPTTIDDIAPHW